MTLEWRMKSDLLVIIISNKEWVFSVIRVGLFIIRSCMFFFIILSNLSSYFVKSFVTQEKKKKKTVSLKTIL